MSSEGNLVDLEKEAAKLIDRGQGPSATDRQLTGIAKRLLSGHPCILGRLWGSAAAAGKYPGAVG